MRPSWHSDLCFASIFSKNLKRELARSGWSHEATLGQPWHKQAVGTPKPPFSQPFAPACFHCSVWAVFLADICFGFIMLIDFVRQTCGFKNIASSDSVGPWDEVDHCIWLFFFYYNIFRHFACMAYGFWQYMEEQEILIHCSVAFDCVTYSLVIKSGTRHCSSSRPLLASWIG